METKPLKTRIAIIGGGPSGLFMFKGVTAPPGKRMGHAGALISGGADTADAKLAIMEECGFKITRNPAEMGKLLKSLLK